MPGYYLYLTHCLQHCPPDQWTVLSPNICNATCLAPYFTVAASMICTPACAYYFSPLGECVDICPSGQSANRTFGCQGCLGDCWEQLNYDVEQEQLTGALRLLLLFTLPLDNVDSFTNDPRSTLSLVLLTSEAPTSQELDVSAFRVLQTQTAVSFSVVKA
jgi:hypothetical protein